MYNLCLFLLCAKMQLVAQTNVVPGCIYVLQGINVFVNRSREDMLFVMIKHWVFTTRKGTHHIIYFVH